MLPIVRLMPVRLNAEKKKVRDLRLTMDLQIEFARLVTRKIRVLIVTGAEINLIRRGIVSPECLTPVKRPLRIAAANQAPMIGGEKETRGIITLMGYELDTGEERVLEAPTEFYEAGISVDAILSYEWLATYDFVVNPAEFPGHKNSGHW